jgi:hypothetical protein
MVRHWVLAERMELVSLESFRVQIVVTTCPDLKLTAEQSLRGWQMGESFGQIESTAGARYLTERTRDVT